MNKSALVNVLLICLLINVIAEGKRKRKLKRKLKKFIIPGYKNDRACGKKTERECYANPLCRYENKCFSVCWSVISVQSNTHTQAPNTNCTSHQKNGVNACIEMYIPGFDVNYDLWGCMPRNDVNIDN